MTIRPRARGRRPEVSCRALLRPAHDAFRRDLDRLAAAAAAGKGGAAHVRAGWENLKRQIRLHHELEDGVLWPRVERAAGGREVRAAVARLRAEHARIEPLVRGVDAAMRDGGDLPEAVRELREALEAHLRHEERTVLAVAEEALTPEDWRAAAEEAGRRCEAEAALFVPWVVDGIAPVARSRFLTALPAPVRERNRVLWEPRYRRQRLWST